MTSRKRLFSLWPRSIGNQCLLMLPLGLMVGLLWPEAAEMLKPVGRVFLQASQIVVMPFLICELVVGFGSLRPGMIRSFARSGVLVLLGLWLVGGLLVVLLPQFLPPLVTSQFFHAGLFDRPEPVDLLETYLPDNISSGLANDNFPAVVLFSAVLGILLQGVEQNQRLLAPLEVMRDLFARLNLNKLTARMIPFGIFALTALNVSRLDWPLLLRIQGFFQLSLVAFLVLSLVCAAAVLVLTPLPMLVENLRHALPASLDPSGRQPQAVDEIAPLVSLGFALPTLGQVAALWFIPFAGWYVDQPLQPSATLRMLVSAIPAAVSGLKAVIRQELQAHGLPLDLLQLVYINGEWLYRFEKVLALESLVVLATLVYASTVAALRPRPLPLVVGLSAIGLLLGGLGAGARIHLDRSLAGTYSNDRKLLELASASSSPQPAVLSHLKPELVALAAILD